MSPIVKEEILVLEGFQTGNTSEVIHALSPRLGRLSIYARGLNRKSSPLRGILQPLSQVEVTMNLREEGEMATLRDAALLKDRGGLAQDLERFSLALLLVEAGWLSTHPGQESPRHYEIVLHGLDQLEPTSPISAPNAVCHSILELIVEGGYTPDLDRGILQSWPKGKKRPLCFWLDLESGLVHATHPQPGESIDWNHFVGDKKGCAPLPPEAVRVLWEFLNWRALPPLAGDHAGAFLDALIRYLEYHQEGHLRSAQFWRKMQGREGKVTSRAPEVSGRPSRPSE